MITGIWRITYYLLLYCNKCDVKCLFHKKGHSSSHFLWLGWFRNLPYISLQFLLFLVLYFNFPTSWVISISLVSYYFWLQKNLWDNSTNKNRLNHVKSPNFWMKTFNCWMFLLTLPKTNSQFAPENRPLTPKGIAKNIVTSSTPFFFCCKTRCDREFHREGIRGPP